VFRKGEKDKEKTKGIYSKRELEEEKDQIQGEKEELMLNYMYYTKFAWL